MREPGPAGGNSVGPKAGGGQPDQGGIPRRKSPAPGEALGTPRVPPAWGVPVTSPPSFPRKRESRCSAPARPGNAGVSPAWGVPAASAPPFPLSWGTAARACESG